MKWVEQEAAVAGEGEEEGVCGTRVRGPKGEARARKCVGEDGERGVLDHGGGCEGVRDGDEGVVREGGEVVCRRRDVFAEFDKISAADFQVGAAVSLVESLKSCSVSVAV